MKFIILLFTILSCTSPSKFKQLVVREYASPKNSYFNKVRYGSFVLDLNLELKQDGTYILTSCAQITTGKWRQEGNFILLECLDRKFIIDSVNHSEAYAKGKICNDIEKYEIKDFGLYKEELVGNRLAKFVLLKK
ncbi:hypothetical protein PG593_01860 [Riemerella anatipestifer]|nr:hypothetical protein [Riemerella anatipestifer]